MFNDAETKLLDRPSGRFPLLDAVIAAKSRCGKCSHGRVNLHSMLYVAVNKYKNDKQFLEYCLSMFNLPCRLGGIMVYGDSNDR